MSDHVSKETQGPKSYKSQKLFWQLASSIFLVLFVAEPLVTTTWYI